MARVTVINDSPQFLDLMRELLAELGHEIVGFEAVKISIEEIVASRPELLVVDLRLEDRSPVTRLHRLHLTCLGFGWTFA